jgi:hypothetical protein
MAKGAGGLWIVIGVVVAFLAWVAFSPPTTIFTCTTFFDFEKQDKWTAFCRAMDSIAEHHDAATLGRIDRWLVVNEYSAAPRADWAERVRAAYPFVDFIQKGAGEKGQAASLNIILGEIRPYTYWIHWEETWYCRRPCLDRLFDAIETLPLSQIQCTQLGDQPNWLDSDRHPKRVLKTGRGTEVVAILPSARTAEFVRRPVTEFGPEFNDHWPLYSLLPSINRVCDVRGVGAFSTDPALWPFKFEWDYGRRWFLEGGTKAVLPDGPAIRDTAAHKSTYA